LLSIGLNCAPLLAPRTGVGRYILGLLHGLRSIAPDGGAGEPFSVVPLFVPAAALAVDGPAALGAARSGEALDRWRRARAWVKELPLAYEARELWRALLLERARRNGLSLLHETNHAAPRGRLPVVVTIHDLATLLYPES
jgi:hypothetical protein